MITPSFSPTATERVLPKLALDFTTASLDPRITFTRALNTATCVNSSGSIAIVNADLPRFDYNPTTLVCKGLLIEETRTNSIRNNTMQGAIVGAPGTMPTNWTRSASPTNGISFEIVATGTDSGISYIDVKFTGTCTSNTGFSINTETNSGIAATASQTWTSSAYVKLQSGSLGNSGYQFVLNEYSSVPAFLRNSFSSVVYPTTSSLITQRSSQTITTGASTAYVQQALYFIFLNGSTYDYTARIGLPQMEAGAFATSVIQTSSGSVTRNADVATMTGTNFSSWWTATNGASDIWLIPKSTTTLAYMSFDDNTANNKIIIANSTTSGQSTITSGGVSQATLTAGTITANALNKIGCSWNTNNCAATANATTPATTAIATIPTVTQLRIGSNGTAYANAWLQKLFYWPQRIINNEIQAFTK